MDEYKYKRAAGGLQRKDETNRRLFLIFCLFKTNLVNCRALINNNKIK